MATEAPLYDSFEDSAKQLIQKDLGELLKNLKEVVCRIHHGFLLLY